LWGLTFLVAKGFPIMHELTQYQKFRLDIAVMYGAALVGREDYDPHYAAAEAVAHAEAMLARLGIVDPDQN
jgi:hypothetical protein